MAFDPISLAATVVGNVLVPFLKRGFDRVKEGIAGEVEDASIAYADKVASKVLERLDTTFAGERDRVAIEDLRTYPEDSQPIFQRKLQAKLAEDPALASELAKLIKEQDPEGGGNVVQIYGRGGFVDARHAHISGGLVAGAVFNEGVSPVPSSTGEARPETVPPPEQHEG